MILIDVNLLIYASNEDAPLHSKTKVWLESVMSGAETICMPWIVILAFLRLTTRTGSLRVPLSIERSFQLMEGWLEQPPVTIVEPTVKHVQILRNLLMPLGTGGRLLLSTALNFALQTAISHDSPDCAGGIRWPERKRP
jgi:predicted nucleic acid-binding protein